MFRRHRMRVGIGFVLLLICCPADAQERFDLSVPGSETHSIAELSDAILKIVDRGTTYTYERDKRYDVPGYVGYSSRPLRQAVRWPTTNQGSFQIGAIDGFNVRFRQSMMQIAAGGNKRAEMPLLLRSVTTAIRWPHLRLPRVSAS